MSRTDDGKELYLCDGEAACKGRGACFNGGSGECYMTTNKEHSRADELHNIFKDVDEGKRAIVNNLIDEAVFIEGQLAELKKYPFIKFHPTNPNLQKQTAAGKQYREYLQTYTNIIDKLARIYGREETEETSPLRTFLEKVNNNL